MTLPEKIDRLATMAQIALYEGARLRWAFRRFRDGMPDGSDAGWHLAMGGAEAAAEGARAMADHWATLASQFPTKPEPKAVPS